MIVRRDIVSMHRMASIACPPYSKLRREVVFFVGEMYQAVLLRECFLYDIE